MSDAVIIAAIGSIAPCILVLITHYLAERERREATKKLDTIHALVNSNMTAVMQSRLDSVLKELDTRLENIDLRRAAGVEPTEVVLTAIMHTKNEIAELRAALVLRK